MLGWSPSEVDGASVINALIRCRDEQNGLGIYNIGGYCNQQIETLSNQLNVEINKGKRQALIKKIFRLLKDDFAYIPLHDQSLSWGVSNKFTVRQRADNVLDWRYIVKK